MLTGSKSFRPSAAHDARSLENTDSSMEDRLAGLSKLGKKLWALRLAAIAGGMTLMTIDEINAELRMARDS